MKNKEYVILCARKERLEIGSRARSRRVRLYKIKETAHSPAHRCESKVKLGNLKKELGQI